MELKDKVAIITGGSRGIGKAVAEVFLQEGASVMLAARSSRELKETEKEFKKNFKTVEACTADISQKADADMIVEKTMSLFGAVDILVNAAGVYGPIGPSESVDFDEWKKTYEINVFGAFRMIQQVLPIMIKNGGGKIINFSGGGDGPLPRFSAYNSSKVAVVRLSETLAVEMKEYRIDINTIAPGPVNTKFLDNALSAGEKKVGKDRYQAFLKQKEEGGVPVEKSADVCLFLASPRSNGLSGKLLSALWDEWKTWDKKKIMETMESDLYTLRRIAPKQ